MKLLSVLCLFLLNVTSLSAIANFEAIYPPIVQGIEGSAIFQGDRHGEFEGDFVAILTDGSMWKIHPDSRETYANWELGERVRIQVRTDRYWFKREHKFALYNYDRGERVKVMLIHHKNIPVKIIASDTYAKSTKLVGVPSVVTVWRNGKFENETQVRYEYQPSDFRKIIGLSDGSFWVIKEHFEDFTLGQEVYIGAQGHPTKYYDFILISGNQREAKWTYGRPNN